MITLVSFLYSQAFQYAINYYWMNIYYYYERPTLMFLPLFQMMIFICLRFISLNYFKLTISLIWYTYCYKDLFYNQNFFSFQKIYIHFVYKFTNYFKFFHYSYFILSPSFYIVKSLYLNLIIHLAQSLFILFYFLPDIYFSINLFNLLEM